MLTRYKYTQKCINSIINNISLIEVIEDLYLKPIQFKNKSRFYIKSTPFDMERGVHGRPFFISLKRRIFKCFYTGNSGNVINFVQQFMRMNKKEAITFLLVKYDKENRYKDIAETHLESQFESDLPF